MERKILCERHLTLLLLKHLKYAHKRTFTSTVRVCKWRALTYTLVALSFDVERIRSEDNTYFSYAKHNNKNERNAAHTVSFVVVVNSTVRNLFSIWYLKIYHTLLFHSMHDEERTRHSV